MDKKTIYLTGGKFNRRKINSYSSKTRPTSQMVRLAVFNILYEVHGVGLDLFCGSGSYAFEALSRGLSFAYLNDNDYNAVKSAKDNAKILEVENQTKITKDDYLNALKYYEENNILFDICFIDPPFNFSDEKLFYILNWLNKTQKKDLRIVVERNNLSSPLVIPGLKLLSCKTYGNKQIFIYQKL